MKGNGDFLVLDGKKLIEKSRISSVSCRPTFARIPFFVGGVQSLGNRAKLSCC